MASSIFNKRTAEAVVAAFALENSRILLEPFELSRAIGRLGQFELTVVGGSERRPHEFSSKGAERIRILISALIEA